MGRPLVFRVHALRRMHERSVRTDEVAHVVDSGEVIEEYPDDYPYASRLVLGHPNSRPLHVVAADSDSETIIITVYEPSLDEWEADYRRRRT